MTETVTEVVVEGSSLNPEVQQEQVEVKARQKGWKPQTEWKGNPEDWVDAKEYIGRQRLFDRIDDLKGELGRQSRKFETDLGTITSHFEKMRQADYERAKNELRSQLKEARRADDVDTEEEIEQELEKLESEKKAADAERQKQKVPQQTGPTPEFQEWQSDNAWFGKDQDMTQEAIAIGTGYAAVHPDYPQSKVLEHVTARIKKLYPESFESEESVQASTKRSAPASVEGGDGRRSVSTNKKARGLTVADLNDGEREIMKVLIKRGALKTKAAKNKISQEDQYLRDLEEYEAAANARQARRQ
jgi:hypothetical protein